MNVLFVEPRGAFSNVFDKFMSIPMLGPVYLGTIAEQAGYNVSIINENIVRRDVTGEELMAADILCVSSMTATITRGKQIAHEYKNLRQGMGKKSRSIIGGIHASMEPEDVTGDFDQVFVGEAEKDILDLLSGKRIEKIVRGSRFRDLDSLPIPNFNLLKGSERMKTWPVMTSRGCPYDCNFCSVTEMFGRGYRVRSVANVMEEIKHYGNKNVFFVDDHFVVNRKRTNEMLDCMKSSDYTGKWSAQLRTEVSKDLQLIQKMKAARCNTVYIGFESINPQSLEEMNKGQSVEDIRHSIRTFRSNGIGVHGMFMFGADSDTEEIFKNTSDFCRKSDITSVQYMILTPLPGTDLYRKLEREKRLLHKNWEYYDAMHVVFKPKNLTPKELQQGMITCYSDFYSYLSGVNDALNAVWNTSATLIKRLHVRSYFLRPKAILLKFVGRNIVKSWVKYNQSYLKYLGKLSSERAGIAR